LGDKAAKVFFFTKDDFYLRFYLHLTFKSIDF